MDTENPNMAPGDPGTSPAPPPSSPSPSGPPPIPPSSAPGLPPRVTPAGRPALAVPARVREKTGRGWKVAVVVLSVLLIFCLLSMASKALLGLMAGAGPDSHLLEVYLENNRTADKLAVIPVEGVISGSPVDAAGHTLVSVIEEQLKLAARDEHVKAVLLKVNSPGGEVLASDDIYRAIEKFQEDYHKPVIAAMGSLAASGGYYVSAPCRWIVANELTITGSIGVIMQTYNYRGLMNKVGVRPMVFKSGKFKDMLSGEKDLENATPEAKAVINEEEAMVQKLVNETYDRFKKVVETGRTQAAKENASNHHGATGRALRTDWTNYADGRILSGLEAKEIGFVDETGNWQTAVDRAKELAGIDEASLVTYQLPFTLGNLFRMLGKTEARPVKIDLGFELPRLQAGLYFLAPTLLN